MENYKLKKTHVQGRHGSHCGGRDVECIGGGGKTRKWMGSKAIDRGSIQSN